MPDVETLRKEWRERDRSRAMMTSMSFTDEGLALGVGTLLAPRSGNGMAASVEVEAARVLALLTAGYGAVVSPMALGAIRRAAAAHDVGEAVLARIHLARAGLPAMAGETEAYRLFLAAAALDEGMSARDMLAALAGAALPPLHKYNPFHGRHGLFSTASGAMTVSDRQQTSGKEKPWERHSNKDMRQALANMESTARQTNDGYGIKGETSSALGRYQLLPGTLVDAGWKDAVSGDWTDKAKAAGVDNDGQFRNNPEAQEKALTDVLQRASAQLKAFGIYKYIGTTIKDTQGKSIAITEAGLVAAAHKEGAGRVAAYFDPAAKAALTGTKVANVERRLLQFESVPYDGAATAAEANVHPKAKH